MTNKLKGGTLAIDVGGTGIKAMVLDPDGAPISERTRVDTPRPATPDAVLAAIGEVIALQPGFERISVGFPGVVMEDTVKTAPNLDGDWADFPLGRELERLAGKPTKVANDADVQGLGVIEGRGVEMVLTLGTGLGSGLYVDGKLVPNLELAHHPYDDNCTYEEYVGKKALEKVGKQKWNKRVRKIIEQIGPIWNYRVLYLGGGNAKKLKGDLPENVRVVDNVAGILGGIRLWQTAPPGGPVLP